MVKGNVIFKSAVAAAIVAATFAVQNVKAGDTANGVTLKPGNGMSFVVGSKRATTYFLPTAGECDVTIMVSEASPLANQDYVTASRMKIKLTPGNTSRFDSFEGKALKFACNTNATTMTISNEVLKVSSIN